MLKTGHKAVDPDPLRPTLPSIIEATHRFCAALHGDGIDPAHVEIALPRDAWWRLWLRVEQLYHTPIHDGRGEWPEKFQFMGMTFKPK